MPDSPIIFQPALSIGQRADYGSASFSTIPTIGEINTSSWLNQMIAVVNRRSAQIDPALAAFAYADSARCPAALINDLRARINVLRGAVAQAAFSFGAGMAAGDRLRRVTLQDLRDALGFPGSISVPLYSQSYASTRTDNPYGTLSSASSAAAVSNQLYGKRSGSGSAIQRTRSGLHFAIPSGLAANADCTLNIVLSSWISQIESFSPALYTSDSDDHLAPSNWWDHLDHNLGMGTYNTTTNQAFSIPGSLVAARAGSYLSCILGEDLELEDLGSGSTGSNTKSGFTINFAQLPEISLLIDFGF